MPAALPVPTGTKFGNWVIVREITPDRRGNRKFLCECTCGAEAAVLLLHLRAKTSASCQACKTGYARVLRDSKRSKQIQAGNERRKNLISSGII